MPVLTFDVGGPDEMDIDLQRGGHAAPRKVGDRGYSASGSEWPQIRDELMVVPFVTAPLPWSQIATIRSLFALNARVNCAGDVFNKPGTIVCSGDLTDELDTTGDRGVISGTLFEIGSTTSFTPITRVCNLTNVTSADDPGDNSIMLGSTRASDDANSFGGETLMDTTSIPTCAGPGACATAFSGVERTWLSVGSPNGGWLTGAPSVIMLSQGGDASVWAIQDCMCKLFIVRSGVDVAQWDTDWSGSNGGFSGGFITMTVPYSVVFQIQVGDQLRVELYARAALNGGRTVNTYQTVTFGDSGGGTHYGRVEYNGLPLFQ